MENRATTTIQAAADTAAQKASVERQVDRRFLKIGRSALAMSR